MADLTKLYNEITNDPLSRGYSTMTNQEIADDLNSYYRTQYRDVSVGELAGVVELNSIYEKLDNSTTLESNKLMRMTSNKSPITSLAYSDPTQRQQIDNLLNKIVTDNIITNEDKDKLQELGTYQTTRAKELNLLGRSNLISEGHIIKVRN